MSEAEKPRGGGIMNEVRTTVGQTGGEVAGKGARSEAVWAAAPAQPGCCKTGNLWPWLKATFAIVPELLLTVAAEIRALLHEALLWSASVGLLCSHVLSILSFCSLVFPPCIFSMRDSTSGE